ncbi:hypothetical protein ACQP2U_42465 (plasmid) [Nocardia sp. CA-084685]|uniref:hypothetical protein n=1 Tax=Nocardia sp. CA-084685 TaxID=3239970 RepID=UPI003D973280
MSDHEAGIAVLHHDGRVEFAQRARGEGVVDIASRYLREALGTDVTDQDLRLGLLTRGGGVDSQRLWCVGLESADLPDNVLLPTILREHPLPVGDQFPRWRGPVVLTPLLDADTNTVAPFTPAVRELIDDAVREAIDDATTTAYRHRNQPTQADSEATQREIPDSEAEMNATRADWACAAVEAFTAAAGYSRPILGPDLHSRALFERVVGDFVDALAELATDKGSDLYAVTGRGMDRFREECVKEIDERRHPGIDPDIGLPQLPGVTTANSQHKPVADPGSTAPADISADRRAFAAAAAAGLETYAGHTNPAHTIFSELDCDFFEEIASDFIADLAHLARAKGHVIITDLDVEAAGHAVVARPAHLTTPDTNSPHPTPLTTNTHTTAATTLGV